MKTLAMATLVATLCVGAPSALGADSGELQIRIRSPQDQSTVASEVTTTPVEGTVSIGGEIGALELILVIDTSRSLRQSDPYDERVRGALSLIDSLPFRESVRIGIVTFDRESELSLPLTSDRKQVADTIRDLGRHGMTDIAKGVHTALDAFEGMAASEAKRAVIVFTDGRSDADEVKRATQRAHASGVEIHTLLLGSDAEGEASLRLLAARTGGSFHAIADVDALATSFGDLQPDAIESVTVAVNESDPAPARWGDGAFEAEVPLEVGENRIVATARSLAGKIRSDDVIVHLRSGGCGELQILAGTVGSGRSVEVILDSSGSMWGRIDGRAKYETARDTLRDLLEWLPADVDVSLRVYGHRHRRQAHDCSDSELLVAPGSGERSAVGAAIAALRPSGQTPLAYSLDRAAADLAPAAGERSVILLTDGIESCGGDPAASARRLRADRGIPVHVIGYGLSSAMDSDARSLRAIARESGGKFVAASNALELRFALEATAGTAYAVTRDGKVVGRGTLGSEDIHRLTPARYEVVVEATPPISIPVVVSGEVREQVSFGREGGRITHSISSHATEYFQCDELP